MLAQKCHSKPILNALFHSKGIYFKSSPPNSWEQKKIHWVFWNLPEIMQISSNFECKLNFQDASNQFSKIDRIFDIFNFFLGHFDLRKTYKWHKRR